MTKRDFVQIAGALLKVRPTRYENVGEENEAADLVFLAESVAWKNCCLSIATVLSNVNPRFDRARFLSACGVEE